MRSEVSLLLCMVEVLVGFRVGSCGAASLDTGDGWIRLGI